MRQASSTRCWPTEPHPRVIAFDLSCSHDHVFETWFRSSSDYAAQLERGLIACPLCSDTSIRKAVMAPNIAAKSNRSIAGAPPPVLAATAAPADGSTAVITSPSAPPLSDLPPAVMAMMAAVAKAQAESLPRSTWVGKHFAEEARAIHDSGEERLIHGQATRDEAEALAEDGIGVMPLLVPVVPPEARN